MQNAYARFIGTIKESIVMMAMEDVGENKDRITQHLKIVWRGVYGGKDKKLFLQFVNEIYTTIESMANLHAKNLVEHPREIRTAKIKEELLKIADEISAQ